MKKPMPVLLVALCVLAGCCAQGETKPPDVPVLSQATLVASIMSDTIALVHRDEDNDLSPFCAGVWLSDTLIVTAFHCALAGAGKNVSNNIADDATDDVTGTTISYITHEEVTGVYEDATAQQASVVVACDASHDLALLKAVGPVPAHSFATLATVTPAVGADVHMVGHPGGLYYSYIVGKVSALHDHIRLVHKLGPFIQVSGPVYNGNSGGGAFDTMGRLVGIASFMPPVPYTGCFISHVSIGGFLATIVGAPDASVRR